MRYLVRFFMNPAAAALFHRKPVVRATRKRHEAPAVLQHVSFTASPNRARGGAVRARAKCQVLLCQGGNTETHLCILDLR